MQLDEEGYKKQLVTLGADNGESVQILSGIKAGDRVVTQGAYQVKLGTCAIAGLLLPVYFSASTEPPPITAKTATAAAIFRIGIRCHKLGCMAFGFVMVMSKILLLRLLRTL